MLLGGLAALIGFISMPSITRWALLPVSALAFAYGYPFLPVPVRWRLRRKNFLKIFLISGVWAWIGAILPLAHLGLPYWQPAALALFASRFLFIAGCTLPFDIRDIEQDRVYQLETVATAFGVRKTKTMAWVALAISWFILVFLHWTQIGSTAAIPAPSLAVVMAIGLSSAITAVGVYYARPDGREYWYLGLLDGTILLQWVLVEVVTRYF